MYAITDCLAGQPQADRAATHAAPGAVLVHLQEHRSHLSQDARVTFTVLIAVFMAMAILPALRGQWLVPAYAIGTMGLLVGVLDWHRRKQPAAEWLAIEAGRVRWRNLAHDTIEWPLIGTRLIAEESGPARLRLWLTHREQSVEIGACLSLEERRAIVPLITRELAAARRNNSSSQETSS
jgi:uncharacterized membrane protein